LLQNAGGARQHSGRALERRSLRFPEQVWFLSLLICAFAVALAFVYADVPIARRVYGLLRSAESLEKGLASAVLLGIEAAVALALVMIRITRGHLSRFGEATALACLTSICAYAINDSILKLFFGVPNPASVLHGTRHAFDLLAGSSNSSFPRATWSSPAPSRVFSCDSIEPVSCRSPHCCSLRQYSWSWVTGISSAM